MGGTQGGTNALLRKEKGEARGATPFRSHLKQNNARILFLWIMDSCFKRCHPITSAKREEI